jgi:hypothetical protein
MAKILNVRERVHQPFRDSLLRTAGISPGGLNATTDLFIQQGRDEGFTNLKTAAILPNDSSMIILAARVLQWFRAPVFRTFDGTTVVGNGDLYVNSGAPYPSPAVMGGNTYGNHHDVYRLHWQCAEGLFWTLGAGDKNSLSSMPSMYFPYGGGLDGDLGNVGTLSQPAIPDTDGNEARPVSLVHFNNGEPEHTAILRLARAITVTPRQLIKAQVTGVAYAAGGNQNAFGTSTAGGRDMLNPISSLNAVDAVQKVVALTIDGLLSRDVQ